MKRIFVTLLGLLTAYIIYIDLTAGTLPNVDTDKEEAAVETMAKLKTAVPAFETEVEPGETLISIVEQHINKPLPVSIDILIKDFQTLNPGVLPEKIQIGAAYQFPDYTKK